MRRCPTTTANNDVMRIVADRRRTISAAHRPVLLIDIDINPAGRAARRAARPA
jgi:hypothetical protein